SFFPYKIDESMALLQLGSPGLASFSVLFRVSILRRPFYMILSSVLFLPFEAIGNVFCILLFLDRCVLRIHLEKQSNLQRLVYILLNERFHVNGLRDMLDVYLMFLLHLNNRDEFVPYVDYVFFVKLLKG